MDSSDLQRTPHEGAIVVVLITRNRSDVLIHSAERYLDQHPHVFVAIVDNGSEQHHLDATRGWVEQHGRTAMIEVGFNSGFGPGANEGIGFWLEHNTTCPWVFVAPDDAHPAQHTIAEMLDMVKQHPMAGLICADVGDSHVPVLDPYFGGMTVPSNGTGGWEDVDYPHGTLFAMFRDMVRDVGLFDPQYFAYCEEAEYGWRAREHGWRCGLARGSRVTNTHLGSSVPLVDYLQTRNTLRLVRTTSGRYHVTIRFIMMVYQTLGASLFPARAPLVFDRRARVRGMVDFVRKSYGPPPREFMS